MARKTSLREFQEYLAGRLTSAAKGKGGASLLGIRAGNEDWLLDLADSGEVVQMPKLPPVPLTRRSFAGLANIRGSLYSVTDFSLFRGGDPTPQNANSRLVLVGIKHGSNAAILVGRMLGLKNIDDFTPTDPEPGVPAWASQRVRDSSGNLWRKLAVRDLLGDEDFMNVGA
ncbi:MAG TPA: chemotaxis protein CheW [Rhodocyclaceae bacterium]|nr:chemotaxis protein CheW [Rhodocyclaceae bacterium]HMW78653.1 chemotaxis protein CheW [Rhodocyclaceae bacterium]